MTFVGFKIVGVMSSSEESLELAASSDASAAGCNDITSSVLQLSDVRFILLLREWNTIEVFCVIVIVYDI